MKITTNDIKKGERFQQRNGWFGTMKDNARGNIRFAEVEGIFTEMGSVYSHDITCRVNADGTRDEVEYTAAQLKCRSMNNSLFG